MCGWYVGRSVFVCILVVNRLISPSQRLTCIANCLLCGSGVLLSDGGGFVASVSVQKFFTCIANCLSFVVLVLLIDKSAFIANALSESFLT